MQLSLVLITLNAEATLAKCLASCDFIDDIVVVDSGSQDNTMAIAEQFGARVIQQTWLGFGKQKQFAVQQAQYDWVLCLDADEWLSDQLKHSIQQLRPDHKTWAFTMPRCNKFMGRFLKHGEGYPDWSLRLFHRQYAQWSDDAVHETVQYQGLIGKLPGDLMHESGEVLGEYLRKQNLYTDLQAEALLAKQKSPSASKMLLSPLVRFIKFYLVRQGWRDGLPGFVHISIGCMNSMMKYAKLYELQRKSRQ